MMTRDLAAADRHRHRQRPVGQGRVVMLAQDEAEHPAGGHVQHAVQVQPASPVEISVPSPYHLVLTFCAGKSRFPKSRATCAIGLPASRASRTAPSLKSWSNFLRVSVIAVL
jgi:hypothetical protein